MKLARPPIPPKKRTVPAFAYRLRTGRRARAWRKEYNAAAGDWPKRCSLRKLKPIFDRAHSALRED